jgi:flagellar motor switch protein FliM
VTTTDVRPTETFRTGDMEVVPHDFRRPDGLTRTQRELVEAALERFGELAEDELATLMRRPTTLDLEGVSESTWGELLASRDDRPVTIPFRLEPLDGTCVVVLPTGTSRIVADLRLGGTGADGSTDPLGTVERGLVAQFAYSVLTRVHASFVELVDVSAQPAAIEPDADPLAVLGADDLCLVARFALTLEDRPPAAVDLCLPPPTVRGMVESLRARLAHLESGRRRPPTTQAAERLAHVPLDVTVQFPAIATTAESLLQLAVGDELALGIPTSEPLEVRAEGLLVARAVIGRSGDRKACSIVEEVLP